MSVRSHKGRCAIEFRDPRESASRFMPRIADNIGFGDFTTVSLYNHETGTGFQDRQWKEMREILGRHAEEIARAAETIAAKTDSSPGAPRPTPSSNTTNA